MEMTGAKSGFPATTVGAILLLQLVVVRIVTWADLNHVWVLGRELHWDCWFKQRFGIPCPTCGMTRSIILGMHGQLKQALDLNAAGPLLVAGLIILATVMLFQPVGNQGQRASRRIALGMVTYGWIFGAVLIGQWTLKVMG